MCDDETPGTSGESMPVRDDSPRVPKPLKPFGIPPTREVRDFEELLAEARAKYPDAPDDGPWELLRDTMEEHSSRPLFRDSEERRRDFDFPAFLVKLHADHPMAASERWEDLRDAMEAHSSRPLFRDSEDRSRA